MSKQKYLDVRAKAKTGDVLMVEGRGLISILIRMFTGEKISHIGLLVWIGEALFVAEFREFKGFQLLPASLWVDDCFEDGSNVYYGRAPSEVRDNSETISKSVFNYRAQPYGYASLFKILAAQIFRINIGLRRLVCSTFVQKMWMSEGYVFERNSDPGDYVELCDYVSKVHGPD